MGYHLIKCRNWRTFFSIVVFSLCLLSFSLDAYEKEIYLRDNLGLATPGDYLVTAQGKNYTLLIIRAKDDDQLSIDEITLPKSRKSSKKSFTWRGWVESGAPGNTCWVVYRINLLNGSILSTFSITKNNWISNGQSQNFLTTLLNLQLRVIPETARKKVGPPPSSDSLDRRPLWQPQMIVDGKVIRGVAFKALSTRWPNDSSELSGRMIEVYLPAESTRYPAYFPYWLQINGMIGKAKVRIVDSGNKLFLPSR